MFGIDFNLPDQNAILDLFAVSYKVTQKQERTHKENKGGQSPSLAKYEKCKCIVSQPTSEVFCVSLLIVIH